MLIVPHMLLQDLLQPHFLATYLAAYAALLSTFCRVFFLKRLLLRGWHILHKYQLLFFFLYVRCRPVGLNNKSSGRIYIYNSILVLEIVTNYRIYYKLLDIILKLLLCNSFIVLRWKQQ